MKISRLRIENYKSFRDSGWIELSASRTVVVGQNNSGKTAFLQALMFGSNPSVSYRGPLPVKWSPNSQSVFTADLIVDGSILREASKNPTLRLYLPIPVPGDQIGFLKDFWNNSELCIEVKAPAGSGFILGSTPSHHLFDADVQYRNALVQYNQHRDDFEIMGNTGDETLPGLLETLRGESIYVFDPERLKVGSCAVAETTLLDPSARNLPAVLATMSRNPAKWEIFKEHVRDVFPSVKEVAVSSLGQEIAIYIWQNDPKTAQGDYAILLQESGTGLAQVLSILYVAMTRTRNIIAIDEPNSFLHPGAAKKLINILKRYAHNQYIVSTHSPELISVIDPDVLLSISWRDGESHVERLDRKSLSDLEKILIDLGCELADVFAADRIVWCEGPTEVSSFPILAISAGLNITGTAFLRLRATGDFEKNRVNVKSVIDIYNILSNGPSLLPRETVFNLDREGRTVKEIDDFSRQSGARIKFLPARTLENFVVDAEAIAAVLADEYSRTKTESPPPSVRDVQQWIEDNLKKYAASQVKTDWMMLELDAPKLLDNLFSEVTGTLHIYRKTHHTVALIQWLLAHKPESLSGLIDYVRSLIKASDD